MSKFTYTNEVLDAYSGQINCEAGIYVDSEIVGIVQYVLFDNKLTVSDIFVRKEFRRMGYGSRLIKYIKQENPEYKYKPSLKTDLGAAFKHKDVSLIETQHFTRGQDPKNAMGTGDANYREMMKMKKLLDVLVERYGGHSKFYMKRNKIFKHEQNIYIAKYYYPLKRKTGEIDEHVFMFINDVENVDPGRRREDKEYDLSLSFPEDNVNRMKLVKDIPECESYINSWIDELNNRWS
jgi:GNAT superfamily N-acetyltransferase